MSTASGQAVTFWGDGLCRYLAGTLRIQNGCQTYSMIDDNGNSHPFYVRIMILKTSIARLSQLIGYRWTTDTNLFSLGRAKYSLDPHCNIINSISSLAGDGNIMKHPRASCGKIYHIKISSICVFPSSYHFSLILLTPSLGSATQADVAFLSSFSAQFHHSM